MAQGNGAIYNNFKEQVMEGVFNLASGGHTLKLTMHTGYTPNIDSHALWADSGVSSRSMAQPAVTLPGARRSAHRM